MKGIRLSVLCISLAITVDAKAFEILLGVEATNKAIWVEESARGANEIAKLDSGLTYGPSVGARTEPRYFDNSQWGYHYQFDGSIFNIDKQELPGMDQGVDVGTSIKGYSLYAVPVGFYHFFKGLDDHWQYKAGLGVGIGYLNMRGSFKITDPQHPEYNQIKKMRAEGVNLAVGVYIEIARGPHMIIIQNYGPTAEDNTYHYLQHNVVIAYRYAFEI